MENSGYVALSRQVTLRRQMEMIANNLANMNTTAYRSEQILFREFLSGKGEGRAAVSFVRDPAQLRDLSMGPMSSTGAALDVAIDGPGYFVIDTPQGPRYTRDGHFKLDDQGQVTTAAGDPVLAGGGPIFVPIDAKDIQIARDGTVSTEQGELGRLDIVTFDNEQLLKRVRGNAYDAGEATANAAIGSEVVQGMLEASNGQGGGDLNHDVEQRNPFPQNSLHQEGERHRRIEMRP